MTGSQLSADPVSFSELAPVELLSDLILLFVAKWNGAGFVGCNGLVCLTSVLYELTAAEGIFVLEGKFE